MNLSDCKLIRIIKKNIYNNNATFDGSVLLLRANDIMKLINTHTLHTYITTVTGIPGRGDLLPEVTL